MEKEKLFAAALGLSDPWYIKTVKFIEEEGEQVLQIDVDFYRDSRFKGSDDQYYVAHDTRRRTWRHLNFFQYKSYIHCGVPRIKKAEGGIETIDVPWARSRSGFTLLFEHLALMMIQNEMPVNKVAQMVDVYPKRLWRVFNHYVREAYDQKDHSGITKLGVDETSTKRGHNYVTVAVDMDSREVIHVTEGKDKEAVSRVCEYLEEKGCPSNQIDQLSMDMSTAYIGGGLEEFEKANITFDKFHIKKKLNEAMDKVRRDERRDHDILKGHKYTFLKNSKNLSSERLKQRDELIALLPVLGEAYRLKILFGDLWEMENIEQAESFLDLWIAEVERKKLHQYYSFINMLKSHWYGIINYFLSRLNNGILEGINSKIQLAKRRARGYRNPDNLKNMIYFLTGGLNCNPPKIA